MLQGRRPLSRGLLCPFPSHSTMLRTLLLPSSLRRLTSKPNTNAPSTLIPSTSMK
ncbi:hypothetical protein HMI54_014020 [Coelomomyces lativittatus]|nr:hypothetical protein HMI54_014020 [Coelomomyces lativittatus]